MCCKGFFKRAIPFIGAMVVGLFITSLFITVAAPSFSFPKRGWSNHREYHRKIERENYRLKMENFRLERKINNLEGQKRVGEIYELENMEFAVPPPPPLAPLPPAAKTR